MARDPRQLIVARRNVRILLVGQGGPWADLIQSALSQARSFSCAVAHVDRLATAVDTIKAAECDFVLVDEGLPDSDGPATVAALRTVHEQMPVVAILATADDDAALRVLKSGAQDYLVRPALSATALEHSILCTLERLDFTLARQRRAALEAERSAAPQYTLVTASESKGNGDLILAGLDVIVVTLTPAGKFASINPHCEKLAGFSMTELKDRSFVNAFVCSHEAAAIEAVFRQLEAGAERVSVESYLLTKGGDTRRIEWSFRTLRKADETIHSYVGVGVDVTRHDNDAKRIAQLEEEVARLRPATHSTVPPDPETASRRAHPRIEYFRQQRIALMEDGQIPTKPAFFEVLCNDISQGGFAYLVNQRPKYQQVVIALGSGADVRYMKSEVRNVQLVEHENTPMFRVGCKFLERIEIKDPGLQQNFQCVG